MLVRDGVLDDERRDALGMGEGQPEADRAAVVLQVEAVAGNALLLEEAIDDVGQVVERVR